MQSKIWLRIALYVILFAVYLVSTVPVGLSMYSLKTEVGLDIFKEGGFHAYMACLSRSFPLSRPDPSRGPSGAETRTLAEFEALARKARAASREAALEALEYERQALRLRRETQGLTKIPAR